MSTLEWHLGETERLRVENARLQKRIDAMTAVVDVLAQTADEHRAGGKPIVYADAVVRAMRAVLA
jgi:hypothetical protein